MTALWTDLVDWAYHRHENVLSWYVRPLFLLPLAWFAHRRSGWGIAATLVALATSMAWFPRLNGPTRTSRRSCASSESGWVGTGRRAGWR